MNTTKRFPALIAYLLPVLGWIYVLVAERKNAYVMFHLKQAIGLVLFLAAVIAGWAAAAWLLAWIPYLFIFSMALFAIVIVAFIFGLVVWVAGMVNAFQGKVAFLPLFGRMAYRLPL